MATSSIFTNIVISDSQTYGKEGSEKVSNFTSINIPTSWMEKK